ncbi:MAG: hypothetical protein OXQ92_16245 [Boseongicola sp.]|nr:hypothetical protein [Boseongicola sp.]MDD9979130.1 hypothetical protein [Boseongicola sp.]
MDEPGIAEERMRAIEINDFQTSRAFCWVFALERSDHNADIAWVA